MCHYRRRTERREREEKVEGYPEGTEEESAADEQECPVDCEMPYT